MTNSVYLNGVSIYNRLPLEGKVGRLAMECDMTEKLILLGYEITRGLNLREHLETCQKKYDELVKLLHVLSKKGKRK